MDRSYNDSISERKNFADGIVETHIHLVVLGWRIDLYHTVIIFDWFPAIRAVTYNLLTMGTTRRARRDGRRDAKTARRDGRRHDATGDGTTRRTTAQRDGRQHTQPLPKYKQVTRRTTARLDDKTRRHDATLIWRL